jgi:hypothetical protein
MESEQKSIKRTRTAEKLNGSDPKTATGDLKKPTSDGVFGNMAYGISAEFFKTMMRTKAEHYVNPANVVFICYRDDKVVDVWKVCFALFSIIFLLCFLDQTRKMHFPQFFPLPFFFFHK